MPGNQPQTNNTTLMRKDLALALVAAALSVVFAALPIYAQGVYVPTPSCWWNYQINGSYLVIYNYGSEAYTIYLMTPDEYQAMSQGSGAYAIGGWVIQPQSSLAIQVPNSGDYMVIVPIFGSCQSATLVWFTNQGAPVGVSSFEPVDTNEVLGFFNITSISAYNPNGESQFDVPNSGASLQLNAILEVQLIDGSTQYYWVQDVISFVTDKGQYNLVDNVWNDTDISGFLSDSTITGSGSVSQASNGYFYAYGTSFQSYSLPIAGYLLIELINMNPLEVSFCYTVIQNGGQYYPPSFNCYDNVTIYTSEPVANAFIASRPNEFTPNYTAYMDAELVFGGYGNDEYTTFNSLSAYLAMLYRSGNAWKPYSDLFMNGWDTAEVATDLTSSVLPNGFIYVTTGSLPSGASTFLTSTAPMPTLPMTYVSIINPATGKTWSGYITAPASFSFPTVVPVGSGTEYVFTGVTVNGATQSSDVVTITPSSDFASYYVSANYEAYYLVSVSSPVPVTVNTYNESATTTEFSEWVPSGSAISVQVPSIYLFNNGTRLVYTGSNETITVNQPLSLSINQFVKQYMVNMSSLVPIIVTTPTGVFNATSLSIWVNEGSTADIAVPRTYDLGNGTRLVYTGGNESITVSKPLSITVNQFIRQYLVSITSLVPVIITAPGGTYNTTSLTTWIDSGSTISINVPKITNLGNGTRLVYTGNNETITVNQPLTVGIPTSEFVRQYLVTVASQYPVTLNGTKITQFSAWLSPGTVLSIEPATVFSNGAFLSEPGYTITVSKPMDIAVQWQVNWVLTGVMYGGLAAVIAIIATVMARRR